MRVICLASAALMLATGSVFATDMPLKAPPAPIVVPYDWTGFYIGINGGYSWGRWNNDGLASVTDANVDGWLGGGQIGYNWQFNQRWVFGLEADIQFTNEKDSEDPGVISVTDLPGGPPPFDLANTFHTITTTTFANSWDFPWFATFRARFGALVDPTLLLYATGGLAVGEFKFESTANSVGLTYRGPVGTVNLPLLATTIASTTLSESTTRAGFALGAGVEKKFDQHWSVKLEYLYLDFGSHTFLDGTPSATSIHLRDHVARIGLNYKF
jgi:opacity protein-like surface antigen